jgi:hypothetical protein
VVERLPDLALAVATVRSESLRTRNEAARDSARTDADAALDTMSADALRAVVRHLLGELDGRAHGRLVNFLINRADRSGSGWVPAPLNVEQVAEVHDFMKAAIGVGQADPADVDRYLSLGSRAFLAKDYAAAHRIFGALLRPIGDAEIDLGQHEMVDEVLFVDTVECAAQYAVSVYMMTSAADRAGAVCAANEKRRRQYSHAAELVATCVACDGTTEAARWAAGLKAEYRRFPALRDGLDRALGAA